MQGLHAAEKRAEETSLIRADPELVPPAWLSWVKSVPNSPGHQNAKLRVRGMRFELCFF
jgi:hypothetical protein